MREVHGHETKPHEMERALMRSERIYKRSETMVDGSPMSVWASIWNETEEEWDEYQYYTYQKNPQVVRNYLEMDEGTGRDYTIDYEETWKSSHFLQSMDERLICDRGEE